VVVVFNSTARATSESVNGVSVRAKSRRIAIPRSIACVPVFLLVPTSAVTR